MSTKMDKEKQDHLKTIASLVEIEIDGEYNKQLLYNLILEKIELWSRKDV